MKREEGERVFFYSIGEHDPLSLAYLRAFRLQNLYCIAIVSCTASVCNV
jgi:hypothetical protein